MNLTIENLSFRYEQGSASAPALENLNFSLTSGECVALIGASGSGKSTLAQQLNGLLKPQSGRLWTDGKVFGWTKAELKQLRRRVGLVFQFPESQIFEATVLDEVAYAARQQGVFENQIHDLVDQALKTVGLESDQYLQRNPHQLSGGESRLISIASLLVVEPDWLILDEPTLGLDLEHWNCICDLVVRRKEAAQGVFLITHDLNLVLRVCPRTLVLSRGRLRYDGATLPLMLDEETLVKFGLTQPEIIPIWKNLRSLVESCGLAADFPPPLPQRLEDWMAANQDQMSAQICEILQRCKPRTFPISTQ